MNTFISGEKVHLVFKDEYNRNNLYVRGRVFNSDYGIVSAITLNPVVQDSGLYKSKITLNEIGFYIVVYGIFTDSAFTHEADPPKNICNFFRIEENKLEEIANTIETFNATTA
jgi:hypothetical protein